jgi:hypothetical protein
LALAQRIVINALGESGGTVWAKMDRISAVGDEMPSVSLHAKRKSSLRQETVANVSAAMRIRNIGMLLNPSPCQIADAHNMTL